MKKLLNITLFVLCFISLSELNLYPINTSKILFDLGEFENEAITETITQESIDKINVNDDVLISVNLNYEDLDTSHLITPEGSSKEEAIALKKQRKELGRLYYSVKNNKISKELDGKNYMSRYISTYLPVIEYTYEKDVFELNKNEILSSLSTDKETKSLLVTTTNESEGLLSDSLSKSNASSIRTNGIYNGTGLKVGILDGGIVIEDHASMSGVDLTIRNIAFFSETESTHATMMAAIVANQSYGILPNASIYSVQGYGSLSGELDWLIDNDVDIINMSIGQRKNYGVYNDDSALCDKVAANYGIVMVAAAGNNNDGNYSVTNPGLGYNVLTLGNSCLDGTMESSSSYVETEGAAKPNLCVVGDAISLGVFETLSSGTSFSSAIMTGMVGALMCEFSDLIGNPAKVYALCMGSCSPVSGTVYSTEQNNLNDQWGTGLFDYTDARSNKANIIEISNNSSSNSTSTLISTTYRYFTIGEPIRISAFWLAQSNGDSDDTTKTQYVMELYNGANQIIATSVSDNSNYMYIYSDDTVLGARYTIKIYQRSTRATSGTETIYLCLS